MRILTRVAVAVWIVASFATPTRAATIVIDFDDVSAPTTFFAQTSQLTDQYAGLGVLFTPDPSIDNRNEILNNADFTVPGGATDPNLLASADFAPIEGIFTIPVFSVGALIGISNGSDLLSIYDSSDNLLGSIVGDEVFVSLSSSTAIARFTVTGHTFRTAAIDNLTFTTASVPEPATFTLLGFGLASVVVRRWRRAAWAPAPSR